MEKDSEHRNPGKANTTVMRLDYIQRCIDFVTHVALYHNDDLNPSYLQRQARDIWNQGNPDKQLPLDKY